jgi:hypothetical protein
VPFDKTKDDLAVLSRLYKNTGLAETYEVTAVSSAAGISATFSNNSISAKSANLILGIYNNGKLVYTDNGVVSTDATYSGKVSFEFDRTQFGGFQYKVFAWDHDTWIPITAAFEGVL